MAIIIMHAMLLACFFETGVIGEAQSTEPSGFGPEYRVVAQVASLARVRTVSCSLLSVNVAPSNNLACTAYNAAAAPGASRSERAHG
jgi:hypothetical protein